jgi:hypothetical protein
LGNVWIKNRQPAKLASIDFARFSQEVEGRGAEREYIPHRTNGSRAGKESLQARKKRSSGPLTTTAAEILALIRGFPA